MLACGCMGIRGEGVLVCRVCMAIRGLGVKEVQVCGCRG